jgi:hypothetical protein
MDLSAAPIRQLAWCLYAVGGMLCVAPLMELAAGLGSLNPGAVPWRFGALGLLSGALILPLTGMALGFVAATILGHRAVVRSVQFLALLLMAAVTGAMLVFALDALQVRSQIPQAAKRAFDLATIKAVLTYAIELVVLAVAAVTALRVVRALARSVPRRGDGGTLVVSQADR